MTVPIDALMPVLSDVLERMAFAEVSLSELAPDWAVDTLVWSRIELRGPVFGALLIGASEAVMATLAESAWGGENDVADPALAFTDELVNTVAGLLLVTLEPASEPSVGLPIGGRGPTQAPPGSVQLGVDVDGEFVGVALLS